VIFNQNEIIELLRELVEIPGVTGFEDEVRGKIIEFLRPLKAHTETDNAGNLYVTLSSMSKATNAPRVMICAHMDEVGFVVNNIDREGFIYLYPLGGIPEYLGPGEWVSIHTPKGTVYGSVGIHPPHLPVSGQREMFVDVGAENLEQVQQMGITVGTTVTFSRNFRSLNDKRVMGRCLDDRVGCAALIALLRQLTTMNLDINITGVFTSTEEHGMFPGSGPTQVHGSMGALVAAMKLRPDFAVVLDSMVCSDIPGIPQHKRQIHLGGGVALRLVDDLAIMRPQMRSFLKRIAAENSINLQEGISRSYTDASAIQLADVPVAALGIPLRYAHSPGQIADTGDIMQTMRLVLAIMPNVRQYLAGIAGQL